MSASMTRKDLLKRLALGGGAGAAASATLPSAAQGRATDGARFTSPYAPRPVIVFPRSWFLYEGLVQDAGMPYDVVISNREFIPLPSLGATPDLIGAPNDLTMLLLSVRAPAPASSPVPPGVLRAVPLNGTTMRFADLEETGVQGFRQFQRWYGVTRGEARYWLSVSVYVGADASRDWRQQARTTVDSIHVLG